MNYWYNVLYSWLIGSNSVIEKDRRKRVNVAVCISHHQMLRHLAAAKGATVQDILDKLLEKNLEGIEGLTLKEIANWEPVEPGKALPE